MYIIVDSFMIGAGEVALSMSARRHLVVEKVCIAFQSISC